MKQQSSNKAATEFMCEFLCLLFTSIFHCKLSLQSVHKISQSGDYFYSCSIEINCVCCFQNTFSSDTKWILCSIWPKNDLNEITGVSMMQPNGQRPPERSKDFTAFYLIPVLVMLFRLVIHASWNQFEKHINGIYTNVDDYTADDLAKSFQQLFHTMKRMILSDNGCGRQRHWNKIQIYRFRTILNIIYWKPIECAEHLHLPSFFFIRISRIDFLTILTADNIRWKLFGNRRTLRIVFW